MEPGFRQRGYHIVSHNYRLGPQASYDVQLQDCLDAVAWCRATLPSILGEDKVDVDRYIISGESAGGHLVTLMAHHLLSPPPRAVVDVYGITDPSGFLAFLSTIPNPANPTPWTGEFSEEELTNFLSDRNPENGLTDALWYDEEKRYPASLLEERWAAKVEYTRRLRMQMELHRWRSNAAVRPKKLVHAIRRGTLHDERFADEAALQKFLLEMSPLPLLEGTTTYPPTAFLHGTADTAAPIGQSIDMAKKLREMGVEVVECYEEGMEHVFDMKYTVSFARSEERGCRCG
jgi:acetyl esterase/lipase